MIYAIFSVIDDKDSSYELLSIPPKALPNVLTSKNEIKTSTPRQKVPEKEDAQHDKDDSVVIIETPPKSSDESQKENNPRTYSPYEIERFEKSLRDINTHIQSMEKILISTRNGTTLPDKGEKLRRSLGENRKKQEDISQKLGQIKNSPPAKNGSVIINDEERLNLLHKKARLLRQQYSALGPNNQLSHGGISIKKQIDEVNKQIMALEPRVRMNNPNFRVALPNAGAFQSPMKQINSQQKVGKF